MGFGNRAREYEKPAAYAFFLLQRALVLGACRQEEEGWAGKIFHSRRSCQYTPPSCATRTSIEVPQVKKAEGQAEKASSLDSAVHFK